MPLTQAELTRFLARVHPYDSLAPETVADLAGKFRQLELRAGDPVYALGQELDGLYLVHEGEIDIRDENGAPVSLLGPGNCFGERGLTRQGRALTSARALRDSRLLLLPKASFYALMARAPQVARFFDRRRGSARRGSDLATTPVAEIMTRDPVTCPPDTPVQAAAETMRARAISSICVTDADGRLIGILTLRDLAGKVLARARPPTTPVAEVMTRAPLALGPGALGADVLQAMMEHRIGHVPICQDGRLAGIVTQTDLTRFQAVSAAEMAGRIARADSAAEMAQVTAAIPALLAQLVAAGNRHEIVTRRITDIADAATRRLLALAEAELGPPPVPYLWLACGSQGRQEQTGVTDQDNCLILHDAAGPAEAAYFERLARRVCDGLDACGYVHCPGEMMASNPRWRQPLRVWRSYFAGWIARPDPEAQMLASVMFDLRPIGGAETLFQGLQTETLAAAGRNSIFVAHMIANAQKHSPPLGLLRGLATIRSGEHKDHIDLKLNGVVPVVDIARICALRGGLGAVNTRARLQAAGRAGLLSARGARDLIDAYDMIAQTRLDHQAARARDGLKPDNFLPPAALSDFERSHLRDAFVVVKTMQSAIGHGQGAPA